MERLGAVANCAPPLRPDSERTLVHERLSDITTIGSDHSPSPWSMKDRENFFEVWGGISGAQHLLALLLDFGISPEQIADLTSVNVAKRFRINHKGDVAVGNDADFTIVDPDAEETITADSLFY